MSEILELLIERPVAGGRMLARHEGRVVFVAGAIPGERVRARVERASKQSLWAETVDVIEASPDRRPPICEPACGGLAFAHVEYERQRELKSQIVADAFRRIARIEISAPPPVAGSPEAGYRLRARFHVRGGRLGFFREGTHTLCDAGTTHQLLPAALEAAAAAVAALGPRAGDCDAVIVAENVAATERVLHLEPRDHARLDDVAGRVAALPGASSSGVTGITTLVRGRLMTMAGAESVSDTADSLFAGASPVGADIRWARRATAFFQGNRFLTGALVRRVLDVASGDHCVDLYAGVGLFSLALAARGSHVVAVEGDAWSGEDLAANAKPWGPRLRVIRGSVEEAVRQAPSPLPDVVVLDPPRTGVSPAALDQLAAWGVPRLVYVSCDAPTLARDAARLGQHGFTLASIEVFDMFPNTPHVESLAVFTRGARVGEVPRGRAQRPAR